MARRKITDALDRLREAMLSYGFDPNDYVLELTLDATIAADVVEALGGEASKLDGLITDADNPVPDLSVKAPQALAEYNGFIISQRRT